MGLDPYSGMDYFVHDGIAKGYVIDLAKLIENDIGLKVEIVGGDQSWGGEVYSGLETGDIDILFGANVTPERLNGWHSQFLYISTLMRYLHLMDRLFKRWGGT